MNSNLDIFLKVGYNAKKKRMGKSKMDLVRKLAVQALVQIEKEKSYTNLVLDNTIKKERNHLSRKDISFLSELIYGVTTWKLTLDAIIQKYAKLSLKKMSDYVLAILRLGAYQIVFLDKVPKSAAVNESVILSKKYANRSSGFVNAILRKVEKQDYIQFFEEEETVKRFCLCYSIPEWMVMCLIEQIGEKRAKEVCESLNKRPNTTIRTNPLKVSPEELIEKFKKQERRCTLSNLEDFFYLKQAKGIADLDLYQKGYFTVQDEGAGLIGKAVCPKPGETILDVCSAPGGKTTHLAEQMNNKGKIVAWDVYESRLKLVEENAKRLGITIIQTKLKDGSQFEEEEVEKYDRVLLDVPCLGLGVMKRKPDIKWQKQKEQIEQIQGIQKQLLNVCCQYVKKGGILLYSTCSILQEENQIVIKEFLKTHPNYAICPINLSQLGWKEETILDPIGQNLYPNEFHDGFYFCKLQKQ